MRRETQNVVLFLVGVAMLMITMTGVYTRYVKPSMWPWLAAGAAVVTVLAVSAILDDIRDGARPVHTVLLRAGIPIAEHLCNLGELPPSGFRFHAVPVKFRGVGTFPVRAYGVLPD